jgi:AcrR family transcriptional regulator
LNGTSILSGREQHQALNTQEPSSRGAGRGRRRDQAGSRPRADVDRREQLLDVALRLFSGRAYADVPIDEIAAEAGVAKGLLYYYFGDKRGLYLAGLKRLADEMFEQFSEVAEDAGAEPLERLMRGIDTHLAFVERYPDGYQELLASASSHPEMQEIVERGRRLVLDLIVLNIPPEVPRSPLIELAIKGWGGFIDRLELAWIADGGLSRQEVRELASRALFAIVIAAIEIDRKAATNRVQTKNDEAT